MLVCPCVSLCSIAHYEPADDSWHTLRDSEVPGPLSSPLLVTTHGDTLLVLGGGIRVAVAPLSEVEATVGGGGGGGGGSGGLVPSLVWDATLVYQGFEGASANLCMVVDM